MSASDAMGSFPESFRSVPCSTSSPVLSTQPANNAMEKPTVRRIEPCLPMTARPRLPPLSHCGLWLPAVFQGWWAFRQRQPELASCSEESVREVVLRVVKRCVVGTGAQQDQSAGPLFREPTEVFGGRKRLLDDLQP